MDPSSSVDAHEILEDLVAGLCFRIVESSEPIGEGDFFDLDGQSWADPWQRESLLTSADLRMVVTQGRDGLAICSASPLVSRLSIVLDHLLQDIYGGKVWRFALLPGMLLHALEFVLVAGDLVLALL